MENLKIIDEIKNDVDCKICFEKFIKLTDKEFVKFCKDNKELLPTFEDDNICRCYEDRFECINCKSVICQHCYWNLENHRFKPHDEHHIEDYEYFGDLDEDGLAKGCPGVDCPIICPFCLTKDYKIFYENQMPYELLNEIKDIRFKREKV